MGHYRESGICVQINHLVMPLICGFVLESTFGKDGIYAAYPVCEIMMTILIAAVIMAARGKSSTGRKLSMLIEGSWDSSQPEFRRSIHNLGEVSEAAEDIASFLISNGVRPEQAQSLALCTEELASNSIEHGFNDGQKHNLEVRSVAGREDLILRVRDDCRRFDLTERYSIINQDDHTSNIGLRIVFAKADEVNYSSSLDLNNVYIRIARD